MYREEAEQSLLGCILLEGDLIKECTARPEQFYMPQHQTLFKAMKKLEANNEPIDLVTVASKFAGNLGMIGGVEYITNLARSVPTRKNFKHYEKLVIDAWKLRNGKELATEFILQAESATDTDVITDHIRKMSEMDEKGTLGAVDKRETLLRMHEQYEKPAKPGITTGYRDLNAMTNGFKPKGGDFIILAARPSVGKTAFLLNVAFHAAKGGAIAPIFSLEMDAESLLKRMQSAVGHIDAMKLRNPAEYFNEDDWIKLSNATAELMKYPIEIFDTPAVKVQDIRGQLRKLRRENPEKPIVAFIDYLQLIQTEGRKDGNRTLEIGEISRELKLIARELQLTIVALSQLSRAVEQRQDKRPQMSDIRDSGNIEQDADIIMFLYRDDYYDKQTENKNVVEVIVAKQRNGPTGVVELAFLKEFNKFLSLEFKR